MPEDFESVRRQFEEFLMADDAGKMTRAEQLKSLLDRNLGDEAGKEMIRTAIVDAVVGLVLASYFASGKGPFAS